MLTRSAACVFISNTSQASGDRFVSQVISTMPLRPVSRSRTPTEANKVSPTETVSSTAKLYGEFRNCGSLSFTSNTRGNKKENLNVRAKKN